MYFDSFFTIVCALSWIPLIYDFAIPINVLLPEKYHNFLSNGYNFFNNNQLKNTHKYNPNFIHETLSFVQCSLDSTPFYINNKEQSQLNNEIYNKSSKLYQKLKLNTHTDHLHTQGYDSPNHTGHLSEFQRPYHEDQDLLEGEDDVCKDNKELENDSETKFSDYFLHTHQWTPADDLRPPYLMPNEELKLSLDKWPENCFLRVKLFSYYRQLATLAAQRIKLALQNNKNLKVTNPMGLPMRRKRWCYLSSSFVDKRSKDLIEIQEHVRVVDIVPLKNGSPRDFKGLLMVPLPDFVSFDYWFEEVHKPVKSRLIHDLFKKRKWVSKYFLYHRDKHEKKELIDKLTSPELINEIPLRWKRKHKLDYYFLQLCELRKLYNFVVSRKAEDEARRFYNVKMPDIWEVDGVRFIGNYQDRRYDPDYSNIDKL